MHGFKLSYFQAIFEFFRFEHSAAGFAIFDSAEFSVAEFEQLCRVVALRSLAVRIQ